MKLIYSPDPWLQKKVEPFNFDTMDAEKIESEMIYTMLQEGGIGLSANQVGLDAQVFVIKPYLLEDKTPFALFNPSIEQVTVNMLEEPEGCLSHPNLFLKIKRPRGIVVNYLDRDAKECKIELYDIDARCFLHEYDHLQGIEFTQRVSKLKLDIARKKQKKISKRNN
jgi:peptide deformylase